MRRVTVSVILPCYNAGSLIGHAINSIVAQTFKDWELVIVDDASVDNSVTLARSFSDPRISVIRLKQNGGYPAAMNAGIEISKGKYIARMDADDISAPARLAEQIKALGKFKDASFCGVARYRVTPGNKYYIDRTHAEDYYLREKWEDLYSGKRIFTDPSVIAEKTKILSVGCYRTFQRSGMDVDLWFRLMERYGDNVTVTKPLFGKRLEPSSIIFQPRTSLVNQVPRILALQRKERGIDDFQQYGKINLDEYISRGLVKITANGNLQLSLGAWVTCLFLKDFEGCAVYWKKIKEGGRIATKMSMLIRKIIARLRKNPYQRYDPSVF